MNEANIVTVRWWDGYMETFECSEVTDSAIAAVMTYMYLQMRDGETSKAYAMRMMDGTYARLKLEVADVCPEWAKETLGVTD